jgi:hypothetical protein
MKKVNTLPFLKPVFKRSMRRRSRTDYLLTNQCSRLRTRTLKEAGREEDLTLAGEDRSSKKRVEAGMNKGFWQLIQVERTHRQPMFLNEQWTLLYYYIILPLARGSPGAFDEGRGCGYFVILYVSRYVTQPPMRLPQALQLDVIICNSIRSILDRTFT